jgi:hypothetical protein
MSVPLLFFSSSIRFLILPYSPLTQIASPSLKLFLRNLHLHISIRYPTTHQTSVSFSLKLPKSSCHPVPSNSRRLPPKNLVGSNRLHNFQLPISPEPLITPTSTKQTMQIHAVINGTPQVDDG